VNRDRTIKRIRKKSLSELDLGSLTEIELSPEDKQDLARGVELFNARKFWEAHEAWEGIWQRHPEDARFFVQALIQLAAAYHQLVRGVYRGFVIHLLRARERLALFPEVFLGIDAGALMATVCKSLEVTEDKKNLKDLDFPSIEIPQITSLPSQKESGWPRQ
jgi:uncharacterized protein